MTNITNKDLKQRLEGYARIMLIWAVLRAVMSVVDVAQLVREGLERGFVLVLLLLVLILALGLYLGLTGYFGVQALKDARKLKVFKIMSIVGAVISGGMLCLYGYWVFTGLAATQSDVFFTIVDALLYATGVYYAWHLEHGTN